MVIRYIPSLRRDDYSVIKTPAIAEHEAQVQDRARAVMQKTKKPTGGKDIVPRKSTPRQPQESKS